MPLNPLVSVIVPTFNRPRSLRTALESIRDQTYEFLEIVVVNDAGMSVDNEVRAAAGGRQFRIINHEQNQGISGALNTGLRQAQGELIAILADDDRYYPHHVATLVRAITQNSVDLAYSQARRVHLRRRGDVIEPIYWDIPFAQTFDRELLLIRNYIPALTVMHTSRLVKEIGYYDTKLGTHEDWDYWIRATTKTDFAYVPEVTCEYTWRLDGGTLTSAAREDFLITMRIIYQRYAGLMTDEKRTTRERERCLHKLENELSGHPWYQLKSRVGRYVKYRLLRNRRIMGR